MSSIDELWEVVGKIYRAKSHVENVFAWFAKSECPEGVDEALYQSVADAIDDTNRELEKLDEKVGELHEALSALTRSK